MAIIPTPIQADLFGGGALPPMRFDWDDREVEQKVLAAFNSGLQSRYNRYGVGTNWYNGASPTLRAEGGERIRAAVRMKLIPVPLECSVCRNKPGGRIHYHSENYWRPLACRPICPGCHRALHKRFVDPHNWTGLIGRHRHPGAWFLDIAMTELTAEQSQRLALMPNPNNARQLDTRFVKVRKRERVQPVA